MAARDSFSSSGPTRAGGVKCWGRNNYGQLGDGSTTDRPTAVNSTGLSTGLQAIALGGLHSCALTTAGGVKCWGYNDEGELGDGSTNTRTTAVDVILSIHNLSGTITVTVGGSPLAGVTVSAGALGDTTTDGSGAYSFTGVEYGTSYTMTPSLTDYDFTPASSSGTVTDDVTHDFSGVYNPATTTSTSSVASTTTIPTTTIATSTTAITTTEPTTTAEPTTTVELTTTVAASTTAIPSTVESTTTASTSIPASTTVEITSTVEVTSTIDPATVPSSTTVVATTTPQTTTTTPTDSDGDGIPDSEEQALGTDPEDADSDDDGVEDSEEVLSGTNPKDPGSKSPKLRSTLCSEWNGYLGGMYNIMEHVNLTAKKIRVKTELRSIRGHLKDTYEFFLRGHQQFDLLVHDMGGRELNSYGQVCTTYQQAAAGSLGSE